MSAFARIERIVRGLIGVSSFVTALVGPTERAQAQGAAADASTDAGPTQATQPAPSEAASPEAAKPPAPTRPATGYGYSEPKREKPAHRARAASRAAPSTPRNVVMMPGFEMTEGGGSRLFVEMTGTPQVEEKKAAGSITYVIKGARLGRRNNRNPLETAHFNTPVQRARLLPSGHDLLFVVDLRQNVAPQWKVTRAPSSESSESSAQGAPAAAGAAPMMLVIEFPKGDFLPAPQASNAPKPRAAPPRPAQPAEKPPPLPDVAPEGESPPPSRGPNF